VTQSLAKFYLRSSFRSSDAAMLIIGTTLLALRNCTDEKRLQSLKYWLMNYGRKPQIVA